jgi:hypothetical protein
MSATLLNLPVREVQRVSPVDQDFAVFERQLTGEYVQVSKGYAHSTSAFAALGRLVQKDTKQALKVVEG